MTKAKMKLAGVSALVIDADHHATALLVQMLRGLGMESPVIVESGEEAKTLLGNRSYDLCIIEAKLPDMTGPDLVTWIRLQKTSIRFVPIIMVTAYSQMSNVTAARDCGAHSVVKKPISPQTLYDHIAWASNPNRRFVEFPEYVGPDRRHKFLGPPGGVGRRADDLPAEIGDAKEPNMSQDEIDALIRPTKVFAE